MYAQNDGDAAFPVASPGGTVINTGMTLRDYFAAKAMVAMASRAAPPAGGDGSWKHIAAMAYVAADFMLAERAK